MEDQVMKLLGPWPILQLIFGLAVLGFGAWMIARGVGKKDSVPLVEDRREEWLAYEHLRNIEENSFKMVELLRQNLDQQRRLEEVLKAVASAIWNRGV